MDTSPATEFELLVAVERGIRYKCTGSCVVVLKNNAAGVVKKPYQKPTLRVYGDVRSMTQTSTVKGTVRDVNKATFGRKSR